MKQREDGIAKLVGLLSGKSGSFAKPKMVVIGGYAMRAFVPLSRFSRDCDFALGTGLNRVKGWMPEEVRLEAFERGEGYGFMRWSKVFGTGKKKAKLGVDFIEGQVRGREGEVFAIDEAFLSDARKVRIPIGGATYDVLVPSYADFFALKVLAARRGDIRDLAALVWKRGAPDRIRLSAFNDEAIFYRNLKEKVIPTMEHRLFLDAWRGTFIAREFGQAELASVVQDLRRSFVDK